MSKRLPSLTSLRTFEAAARNLSFAKASQELNVTPAAVGFQIKQLEEELGGNLFLRKHRAIELTNKGRQLVKDLGPAFEIIQTAWQAAHEPLPKIKLKISGPARAVHGWALPAITDARAERPDVEILWDLSKQNRNVADGQVDMAIRWALNPDDSLPSVPLLRTWFTPVMRPDVARFVKRPADLTKLGLIGSEYVLDPGHSETVWASWLRLNGLAPPDDFAVTCADTASAVETAVATGHVAIAGSFLVRDQMASGALVAPFDIAVAPQSQFWLICRSGLEETSEYQWVLSALQRGQRAFDAALDAMQLYHSNGEYAKA